MRPVPSRLVLSLALLCTLSCSESTPTGSSAVTPRGTDDPAFTFVNGPAELPIIVRFEDNFGFFFIDFENHILSLHSPNNGRRIDFADCQSVTVMNPQDLQLVFAPSGAIHLLALAKDNFVTVHDWSGEPEVNCDFVNDESRLLATGQVQMIAYDNDVTGTGGQGTNSFGNSSSGRVNLVGGGTATYKLKREHLIYRDDPNDPDDEPRVKFNVVRIGPLLR
jgi:hypothetical protein